MSHWIRLRGIDFEWDPAKARRNLRKHGVSFEAACECFFDPFFVVEPASIRAVGEKRALLLGITSKWRFLSVVYVDRRKAIRIISARRMTPAERKRYENQ